MRSTHQSPESERHIIGLTLLDKHIPHVARELVVSDFMTPQYRATWTAFLELDSAGREIDYVTAHEIIKRSDPTLADWFTPTELVNATRGMVHTVNDRIFVKAIKEASLKRYLAAELNNQINALDTEDGDAVLSSLKHKIEDLNGDAAMTGHFKSLAEVMENEVKPALRELHEGHVAKIKTGWEAIDRAIGGGLSTSDVMLVAGLPGSGKSAFALMLTMNIAKQGVPVAFISREMSNKENGLRMISQAAKFVNLNSVTHLTLTEHDQLTEWADSLKQYPVYLDYKTSDLQSLSRSMRSLVELGVKVVVVDYIQIIKAMKEPLKKAARAEHIADASMELKRIAMEYDVAVIELAQFNREGAKSGTPRMHDLEGSSQLEKDASLIFILDRESQSSEVTLRIEKGRNTGLGTIHGVFQGPWLRFEF